MRGKDEAGKRIPTAERITPAYAGKRTLDTDADRGRGDHPRLCGEKLF